MSDVTRDALSPMLHALEEQLRARGLALHLVVIGGSGLLAMGLGDRPTQDVDVVAFLQGEQLVSAQPFPPELAEAARRVADDFGPYRAGSTLDPLRYWRSPGCPPVSSGA